MALEDGRSWFSAWGDLPTTTGRDTRGMLEAAASGQLQTLVLLGADPVGTWPGGERWQRALGRCFFTLAVSTFQDGSSGWATTIVPASATVEKEGTLTNLEGRVLRRRKAIQPPAGARSELWIMARLAEALEAPSTYSDDPETVFEELRLASAGGPSVRSARRQ